MPVTAQTNTADLIDLIPLADLYIHPLNTRSEPPPADIEALADCLDTLGLMQNLNGFDDPNSAPGSGNSIGIVAGGRRLRALLLLAQRESRDPAQTMIPVRITSDAATAQVWASAENTARMDVHPADEIRAYGKMASTGADTAQIARAFAVNIRHVQKRLKLASLPDAALQSLRDGKLSLDQAGALTSARNDAALLAELKRATTSSYMISPNEIRRNLRGASVSGDDRRVKYIGLDAYTDAGGVVTTDLWSENTSIEDEALLQSLFDAALTTKWGEVMEEGWLWVKTTTESNPPYDSAAKLDRIYRAPFDLPEGDADELDNLGERSHTQELTKAELERMEELETRAEGSFTDEDIATSGLWLYVDHHGELQRFGPYRDPKDDPNREPEAGNDDQTATATTSRALPANLTEDLSRIRLGGLQLRAADQPELMLDLLAYQLTGGLKPWQHALSISTTPTNITPEKPEGTTLPDRMDVKFAGLQGQEISATGFAAFQKLGKKHRNAALAEALARLIPTNDLSPALAAKLQPDMRSIWTPTKSGYLGRLTVALLDDLWCQLLPDDRTPSHAEFRELKKGEKADLLHNVFNDADWREAFGLSRDQNARLDAWLPAELQWSAVEDEEAE